MNLPEINKLNSQESTYITLSKSMFDFDKAIANSTEYYFTKMVALNIPVIKKIHTNSQTYFYGNDLLTEIGYPELMSPNLSLPKMIQNYLENLIRNISNKNISEIGLWKMFERMGLSKETIKESIVFVNDITTSNFIEIENNHGWSEIVCSIPNDAVKTQTVFKPISIQKYIDTQNTDKCLYDNNMEKSFIFDDQFIIDFENTINISEDKNFDFNMLLLFYMDSDGVHKLHGINIIYPFDDNNALQNNHEFTKIKHNVGIQSNIGYQFIFNIKTCLNDVSKEIIVKLRDNHNVYKQYGILLDKLSSFLETKM